MDLPDRAAFRSLDDSIRMLSNAVLEDKTIAENPVGYWVVEASDAFDPHSGGRSAIFGDIQDDLSIISLCANGERVDAVHLEALASVLRYIAWRRET